jgi:hypothetical protein
MTQTAALTQKERAEIQALCEPLRQWARYAVTESIDEIAIENVFYWQAAAGIERLLDALEAAERERDEARRMLSPGE